MVVSNSNVVRVVAMASAEPSYANDLLRQEVDRSFSSSKLWFWSSTLISNTEFCATKTMKWRFWKRNNKSKTAKASKTKRQRKSKECAECESLSTIVEGEFVVLYFWRLFCCGCHMFTGLSLWFFLLFMVQSSGAIVIKWFNSNRSWMHYMISLTRE